MNEKEFKKFSIKIISSSLSSYPMYKSSSIKNRIKLRMCVIQNVYREK